MIQVAILGYGTVGSGVYEVLKTNRDSIKEKTGDEIHVKYVLDLRDFPGDPVEEVFVHDYEKIISDPDVDIVVEVMGCLLYTSVIDLVTLKWASYFTQECTFIALRKASRVDFCRSEDVYKRQEKYSQWAEFCEKSDSYRGV